MITLYGIKICDKVKKAKAWLSKHNIEYQFHDFREQGISKPLINQWLKQHPWQELINTRGTTYRDLSVDIRKSLNKSKVIELILEYPTIIKRPILKYNNKFLIGFTETLYNDNLLN